MEKDNRNFKIPHTFVFLVVLIMIVSLLSYIVPASTYDLVEIGEREVVDPATFRYVEITPVTFGEFMTAIPRGMEEAAGITFFIFYFRGSF